MMLKFIHFRPFAPQITGIICSFSGFPLTASTGWPFERTCHGCQLPETFMAEFTSLSMLCVLVHSINSVSFANEMPSVLAPDVFLSNCL
jgi:hypothetical protein